MRVEYSDIYLYIFFFVYFYKTRGRKYFPENVNRTFHEIPGGRTDRFFTMTRTVFCTHFSFGRWVNTVRRFSRVAVRIGNRNLADGILEGWKEKSTSFKFPFEIKKEKKKKTTKITALKSCGDKNDEKKKKFKRSKKGRELRAAVFPERCDLLKFSEMFTA